MKKLTFWAGMIYCIMLVGCKKNAATILPTPPLAMSSSDGTVLPIAADGEPMALGTQMANPYTLTAMQASLDSLNDVGIYSEREFTVRVTHKYLKYYPTNEDELDALHADTNLFFYDYPLDYEVLVQGNFYHEPGISDSLPTPQYVVVPEGYTYNTTVAHEILEHLYIPEEDIVLLGTGLNENLSFGNLLLDGAHKHVDPFFEPANPWTNDPITGVGGSSGIRNGTIRIFDNRLDQFIPMAGAEVTANRWFTTYSARVKSDGTYALDGGPFKKPADFAIYFRADPDFKIMSRNKLHNAKIVRNNISGNVWNYDIAGGLERMNGTMFRAAYRYYYGNTGGLLKPKRPNSVQKLISKD
jgi:hypothetical protein